LGISWPGNSKRRRCLIGGAVAGAFLRQHDAAFALDGLRRDRQLRGGLPQQFQRGVDGVVVGPGQVEFVDGLIEIGRGVGVGPEGQPVPLQDLDHLVLRHRLGPGEGHVLEEVGETLLGVGLHQRAGVKAQAQRRLARRDRLALDGVAHAVGERTEADVGIGADIGSCLRPLAGRQLLQGRPIAAAADLWQFRQVRQPDRLSETGGGQGK
jgi:hypothetical protein